MKEVLTYTEIKNKVGDAWALIYEPVFSPDNGEFIQGQLVDFDTNKQSLINKVEKNQTKNLHFTIKWFGEVNEEEFLLNIF